MNSESEWRSYSWLSPRVHLSVNGACSSGLGWSVQHPLPATLLLCILWFAAIFCQKDLAKIWVRDWETQRGCAWFSFPAAWCELPRAPSWTVSPILEGLPCPNGPLGFPSGSTCEIKVITFLDRFSLSCIYWSKGSRSGDGRGMALKEGIARPQQQNQDLPYSSVACSSVFLWFALPRLPCLFSPFQGSAACAFPPWVHMWASKELLS